ncbi:Low-density lipoprotein receptor-related protein 1B [Anthophora plagiata]
MDCNNEKDEENCLQSGCRPDEFMCLNGDCVSQSARCDGRSDCRDRSDEYNCNVTTCSSDQFRCQDGTCISIDKRCNQNIDCRNGEDETQCGCGDAEFRCTDGRCIGYELQCNGVEECSDGSDERDCVKYLWRNVYNDETLMKRFLQRQRNKINLHRRRHDRKPKKNSCDRTRSCQKPSSEISSKFKSTLLNVLAGKPNGNSLNSARNILRSLEKSRNVSGSDTKRHTRRKKKHPRRRNMKNDTDTEHGISETFETSFLTDSTTSTTSLTDKERPGAEKKLRKRKRKRKQGKPGKYTTSTVSTTSINSMENEIFYNERQSTEAGDEGRSTVENVQVPTESEIEDRSIKEENKVISTEENFAKQEELEENVETTSETAQKTTDWYWLKQVNLNDSSETTQGITDWNSWVQGNLNDSSETTQGTTNWNSWEQGNFNDSLEAVNTNRSSNEDLDKNFTSSLIKDTSRWNQTEEYTQDTVNTLKIQRSSEEESKEEHETTIENEITLSNFEDWSSSTKEEDQRSTLSENVSFESLKNDSEERSASREEIYDYRTKGNSSFSKYYYNYAEESVTPSVTTEEIRNIDDILSVKVETELFESNAKNSKVDLILLSRNRLSNEILNKSSTSVDRTLKEKLDKCTSKCAEFWRKEYERSKKKKKEEKTSGEGNIDSGLVSVEESNIIDVDNVNCVNLSLSTSESKEIFDTSVNVKGDPTKMGSRTTMTTVPVDLVEVISERNRSKTRESRKRKKNKHVGEKGKGKKHKDWRNKQFTMSEQGETTTSLDQTTWKSSTLSFIVTKPAFSGTINSSAHSESNTKELEDDKKQSSTLSSIMDEITLSTSSSTIETSSPPEKNTEIVSSTTENNFWTKNITDFDFWLRSTTVASSEGKFNGITIESSLNSTSFEMFKCEESQFPCDNGACISSDKVCNGIGDCRDYSDEFICDDSDSEANEAGSEVSAESPDACRNGEFACDGICISNIYNCDGKVDCKDRADELNCSSEGRKANQTVMKQRGSDVEMLYKMVASV